MDEEPIRRMIREYIHGADYSVIWHRYLDITWDVLDCDFIKKIDHVWAEYLNKFLSEDEFKSELRKCLDV